jgi:hypothetical protein
MRNYNKAFLKTGYLLVVHFCGEYQNEGSQGDLYAIHLYILSYFRKINIILTKYECTLP